MDTIFRSFRQKVSADKNRYRQGDYDLDLTYITSRVIAMAYPAEGVESTYRNNIDDVARMLTEQHCDKFMLYNLSNRPYDVDKFSGLVAMWCGFPDHHPPPLSLMFLIIHDMEAWLQSDPDAVIVVHCLAGKGRTGTLIAAFFLYSGLFEQHEEALNFFAYRRSHQVWGVTGPSQLRYVNYFEDIVLHNRMPNTSAVMLTQITLHNLPRFQIGRGERGVAPMFDIYLLGREAELIFSSTELTQDVRAFAAGKGRVSFYVNCALRGDILIHFRHMTPLLGTEPMFHFVFNTLMLDADTLILKRHEIEKGNKDPRFPVDFSVSMRFHELTESAARFFQEEYEEKVVRRREAEGEGPAYEATAPQGGRIETLLNLAPTPEELEEERRLWTKECASSQNGEICFTGTTENKIALARDIGNPLRGNVSVKGGWLLKRGHRRTNWKRRWFVLKGSTLSYHKGPRELKSLGVIPVMYVREVLYLGDVEDKHHCFEVVTCQTRYVISAESDHDMKMWAGALVFARNLHRNQGQGSKRVGSVSVEIIEVSNISYRGELYCTVVLGDQKYTVSAVSGALSPRRAEAEGHGEAVEESERGEATEAAATQVMAGEAMGALQSVLRGTAGAASLQVVEGGAVVEGDGDEDDDGFVLEAAREEEQTIRNGAVFNEQASFIVTDKSTDLSVVLWENEDIHGELVISVSKLKARGVNAIDQWFQLCSMKGALQPTKMHLIVRYEDAVDEMLEAQSHLLFLSEQFSHLKSLIGADEDATESDGDGATPARRVESGDELVSVGSPTSSPHEREGLQVYSRINPRVQRIISASDSRLPRLSGLSHSSPLPLEQERERASSESLQRNARGAGGGGEPPPPPSYPAPDRPLEESPPPHCDLADGADSADGVESARGAEAAYSPLSRASSQPDMSSLAPAPLRCCVFRDQFPCQCDPLTALAPVGDVMWSGDRSGIVRIWDVLRGSLELCFKAHNGTPILDIAFDGKQRAWTCGVDGVGVWDTNTCKLVRRLRRHKGVVQCLAYVGEPGAGQMWSASSRERNSAGTIMIWDAASLECIKQFELGQSAVGCMTPANNRIWVGMRDYLFCFDAETQKPVSQMRVGTGMVTVVVVLDDIAWFCSEGSSRICVWNTQTNALVRTLTAHEGRVCDIICTGDRVWSCSEDLHIMVWDRTSLQCLQSVRTPHMAAITKLSRASPTIVCTTSDDTSICLWQILNNG